MESAFFALGAMQLLVLTSMKATADERLVRGFQLPEKIQQPKLPLLVVLTGVLLTLFLQFYVSDGVFFSGDGGLKALLAQQFASGELRFDLSLPAADWVRELWQNGLYPFLPPFVYNRSDHYYITFPFTFPLVTAPFYALFGHRGLYVIPIAATWVLWFRFYKVCQQLKVKGGVTAIALVALIFASPLSIYSAMYWEHTLAVVLAFYGLTVVLFPTSKDLTLKDAITGGVLIGLSVWFRPEFLCLVSGLLLLALAAKFKWLNQLSPASGKEIIFSISLLITVFIFFGINKTVYGHPLGIHALQVVEEFSLVSRLLDARDNFKQLVLSLAKYFPILLFPVLSTFLFLQNTRLRSTPKIWAIYSIAVLFICAVPLIVPAGAGGKQWGPRFLLILIPLLSLLSAIQLKKIMEVAGRSLRYIALGLVFTLLTVGIHLNTFVGTAKLMQDYRAVAAALTAAREDSNNIVAISHQYIAQAMAPALKEKTFLLAEDVEQVKQLSMALINQEQQNFLYICYHHRPCPVPDESTESLTFRLSNQSFRIMFSALGDLGGSGRYFAYKGSILKATEAVES